MDNERMYVTQALCEHGVFEKLRGLILDYVSGIYDIIVKNNLNHKYYFLKFIVKTTPEKFAKLCEKLQDEEIIIMNCYELIFPAYKIEIRGDAEKCMTIQKELSEILLGYGAIPVYSEIKSGDFIEATYDIIVLHKDPSNSIQFLEFMSKHKDLTYKIFPVEYNW